MNRRKGLHLRILVSITSVALLSLLAGCGKKRNWGRGCEQSASLTSPWTDLGLPVQEDGNTRVCKSDAETAQLRTFAFESGEEILAAFDQAFVAAGWEKDRCTGQSCNYAKDDRRLAVQPFEFTAVDGLFNVELRMRKRAGR